MRRGGDGEAGKYGGSLNSRPSHVLTSIRLGVCFAFIGVLAELLKYRIYIETYLSKASYGICIPINVLEATMKTAIRS